MPTRPKPQLPAPILIRVRELNLDAKNPRLAGEELSVEDQERIVEVLWQDRAVNELVDSIAASGYWPHEVLFASREGGKLVVIEGNRRLAAVKLLTDEGLRGRIGISGIPTIDSSDKEKLAVLPVIECSREDVWQYIGFKHVNGPQDWDSLAKAEYIARVHNEYRIPLDQIARTIGDRHDTVRRLYRGLMVLTQAAESGQFDRGDRFNTRFAYSHLWTGLGLQNIQKFLGLTADKGYAPNPVPKSKLENLGELCNWLYGSKQAGTRPLVRSQNPDLRILDECLGSEKGIAALRSKLPLSTAVNASRGDSRLLREALVLVEQKIKEARGLVLTGFSVSDDELLETAKTIRTVSGGIVTDMERLVENPPEKTVKKRAKKP
jgi:hypothetical protein